MKTLTRRCARKGCRNRLPAGSLFLTCSCCRKALPDVPGGCKFWQQAAEDPRVTKTYREMVVIG